MKAVILVAGKEKKFYPLTEKSHQCLLNVGGKTIIENTFENLLEASVIKQAILVVGHKAHSIKNKLGNRYKNIHLSYVKNEDYENTGTLASLSLVKDFVYGEEFLLLDGDILFDKEIIYKLLKRKSGNILIIDSKKEVQPGEMLLHLGDDGKVKQIQRAKEKINPKKGQGVFIGISKFSASLSKKLFDKIKKIKVWSSDETKKLPYEYLINKLCLEEEFSRIKTEGFKWLKIDEIKELKSAQAVFGSLDSLKKEALALGADHVYKILPSDIVFDERVKLKCATCSKYDGSHTCPPKIPNVDYQKLIKGYDFGLLIAVRMKIKKDNFAKIRKETSVKLHKILLDLEKKAYKLNHFYSLAFIGGSCKLCEKCGPKCSFPQAARIPLEATGCDVIQTVKNHGIKLEFPPKDYLYRVGVLLVG